jgi:uncharacterized protein (DUF1778 family)
MKKRKSKPVSKGRTRARRPKSGKNKGFLITMSIEEKLDLEKAAAIRGVSLNRFIMEKALEEARSILSKSA